MPDNSQCYLCEKKLAEVEGEHFQFQSDLGNDLALCAKCMHRFGIPAEEHPEAFLVELQSVVFGYKTNYRCPQCWEAVRFRGIFNKMSQCYTTKQLVHHECGGEGPDGNFHMKNVLAEFSDGLALDAPPSERCDSCQAPVNVEGDDRFNNCSYACNKCSKSLCDRCKGESVIEDSTIVDCKVCIPEKGPNIIARLYQRLRG